MSAGLPAGLQREALPDWLATVPAQALADTVRSNASPVLPRSGDFPHLLRR